MLSGYFFVPFKRLCTNSVECSYEFSDKKTLKLTKTALMTRSVQSFEKLIYDHLSKTVMFSA